MKIKHFFFLLAFLSIVGWGPSSYLLEAEPEANVPVGSRAWIDSQMKIIESQANNLDPTVLKLALTAYVKARAHGLGNKKLLTIIDYSKYSTEQRLWVVDLNSEKVLFNTWVAHGKNSGRLKPDSFSNQFGSLKSSLGLFLTESTYMGNDGYSLHLIGLEKGINNNAYTRHIVMHGATYVGPEIAKTMGRLGLSWGCPAVSKKLARPIIDTIKNKTLVFVYGNDQNWLRHSPFLVG